MSKKPKLGRPPGRPPSDNPKDGIVKFRCRRAEKGHWVKKARKANVSLSVWLTELANNAD